MKAIFILFDSLNRQALSCYNPAAAPTPAFERLASCGVTFENHYAGSLPCMPARRDLLTGKLNFLHRSWGPVEPFDQCFPDLLRQQGIYSHLISDHYHYWEEGGCGYHNRYSSAEFVRGQERDLWKAMVQAPIERFREQYHPMLSDSPRRSANMVNREFIQQEDEYPIAQCVKLANEFIATNHSADNWLLQVELFDPHEPFTAPMRFRPNGENGYQGPILDWPIYDKLKLSDSEAAELRANYSAIVSMCDHYLGKLLDTFDQYSLWEDTAIILTTDHGFLLGEHDWWGKNRMPMLDPIVHIPLMMYHPNAKKEAGQRKEQLTQCLDIPATILDIFTQKDTVDASYSAIADGKSLIPLLATNQSVRDFALFGIFGGAINITDGQYTYFHYPTDSDKPFYEYTLMPVHPASYFTQDEFQDATLVKNMAFGNGYPLLRLPATAQAHRPPMQGGALGDAKSVLYDLHKDPLQQNPIMDDILIRKFSDAIRSLMRQGDAPTELYERFF